jgi:sulfatase modifying factor 1
MKKKKRTTVVAVALMSLATCCTLLADEETPGWATSKPASGRFVAVGERYMVPYTVEIPGTNVPYSMEPIPGGTMWIGSPESESGHSSDEGPRFEVTVSPFWIGKYEVAWAEYKEFMGLYSIFKEFETRSIRPLDDGDTADAVTAPTELYDPSFTFEFGEDPRQPAVTMTQYSAKQYTKWLSAITSRQYRLPSEAEWEYACRAGTATSYSFGDTAESIDDFAWYFDNSDEMPHHVGTKKPNPFGLHDMHGNVWEWVLDAYSEDGFGRFAGKKTAAADTIAWPDKLYPRIVRGGSWDDDATACRSAAKMPSHDNDWKAEDPNLPLSPWWFTSDPARAVGFRLVRPLTPLPASEMDKYWEPDVEAIEFSVSSRLEEGRGVLGLVDEKLPAAIEKMQEDR